MPLVCFITFTGDVVFAGCGKASTAVAVDGCNPELIPALRLQIRYNHVLRKGLKSHNMIKTAEKMQLSATI